LLKIDVAPLAPKLRNNRTVHYDYLKHTQEEIATLRELVENERLLNPLNTSLDYACKYTKRIQDFLIILKQTCPCIKDLGDMLMAVTSVNKTKKIRFTEPVTSSGNTPIKTTSSSNVVSNKPMLSSTGVNLPTSASGSQRSSNTKKDRIQQTQRRAMKNKLEAYPRNVRTSLQNKKSAVNTKDIASVPNSKLNASKTKSWLWPRRLSHLNFGTINHLARQGLVRGLPKLKFEKDHICHVCAMGKSKKKSHKPKSEDTNQETIYLLHMDLCGPIRVESVNGKKYILVIVNDYSRFTWVKCVRSKDEASDFIIKFLKMIQVRLKQNGVVKRRNRTLIKAVRTIRIVETIRVDFDELTEMASEQSSSGLTLHEMTPATISSGLMPKPTSSTPFVLPTRNDWDLLFQPMFEELLTPPPSVDPPAPKVINPIDEVVAPELAESTGLPSSTTINQDAPSPIKSQTTP
nr:ribonuclease H-like domain-containing protein [Tanacetum cinerariifolium]